MELYNFFRSGTSHRLRIALNLKGLTYLYRAVDLRTEEHQQANYRRIHPQGFVPALVEADRVLIQTPAILEWLEEAHPVPALLPYGIDDRVRVRAMAAVVGCDIHPLNNRRVLEHLRTEFSLDDAARTSWCTRWITAGFDALEAMLSEDAGRSRFCFGDTPSLADVYLLPQIESARRFRVDMTLWPRISQVDAACSALAAFANAEPSRQPDAS